MQMGGNYRCKCASLFNTDKKLLTYIQYSLKKYFSITTAEPYLITRKRAINGKRNREIIITLRKNWDCLEGKKQCRTCICKMYSA